MFSAGWFTRNTAIGRTYNVAKHRMKASPNPIEKPDELKPLDLGKMDETALTALGQIRKIDQLAKENDSTLVVFYIKLFLFLFQNISQSLFKLFTVFCWQNMHSQLLGTGELLCFVVTNKNFTC